MSNPRTTAWRVGMLVCALVGAAFYLVDPGGAHWPHYLVLYISVAALLVGLAFGPRGAWLPVIGTCSFGVVWLLDVGVHTNPSTGDNETGIVPLVTIAFSLFFALVALVGAGMRWVAQRHPD